MSFPSRPALPSNRYLIATLFIAAMLLVLAVVQGRRSTREGGTVTDTSALALSLDSFETVAEFRLEEGWAPRFEGAQDPDQWAPWPFQGGFGAPWEPASPYLRDQGLALNGPGEASEVVLWRGLEWRRFRFEAPLVSARLDPGKGTRLLVTLQMHARRFETRLLEIPEGRVLWAVDSGPWSRFNWDGKAALVGLQAPSGDRLLLSALPLDTDLGERTLAPWDEAAFPAPPKGIATTEGALWPDGQDLPGAKVLLPWGVGDRFWFPRADRLWSQTGTTWSLWGLEGRIWRRLGTGTGLVVAQPPRWMGRVALDEEGKVERTRSSVDQPAGEAVPPETPPWPAADPAWVWAADGGIQTAWDSRWTESDPPWPPERQREGLARAYRPDWITSSRLRVSIPGWLPTGPEVVLREAQETGWAWVGDRVVLVKLQPSERPRLVRKALALP